MQIVMKSLKIQLTNHLNYELELIPQPQPQTHTHTHKSLKPNQFSIQIEFN